MLKDQAIRILYDGNCPICCRKVRYLQKRDRAGALRFSDIRDMDFQPSTIGIPMEELEKQIHAVLPDGSVISRMEVIRAAYREIGLGWLAAPTAWPLLRPLFDCLYGLVAKYRLSISRFFP
ncbi:MAG: DUF393 domain-containing protein [Kiritimatiellales bacterium]|nr:DUF393 domain-containing protein [Kiritimatiellales bacterium]MCF7864749.1 DUF393 domain-containing protein [Kiritimatiellales bacterium]